MGLYSNNNDYTNNLMLTYTVHKKNQSDSDSIAIYVPERFSWTAMLLTPFWILYHKLWGVFIGYLICSFLINELIISEIINTSSGFVLYYGLSALFGFSAFDFYRDSLKSKGFKLVDIIIASSEDEAELKYISYHVKNYETQN